MSLPLVSPPLCAVSFVIAIILEIFYRLNSEAELTGTSVAEDLRHVVGPDVLAVLQQAVGSRCAAQPWLVWQRAHVVLAAQSSCQEASMCGGGGAGGCVLTALQLHHPRT